MNMVTRELFDLPDEMAGLPRDHRGYPIPMFVGTDADGKRDFRFADTQFWSKAVNQNLCWLCGGHVARRKFFVIGPMCTITRTTAEPPCHRGCAIFAVKNCPFLTKPMAVRNERDMPDNLVHPGGTMIRRNPGVTALWETTSFKLFKAPDGKWLIKVGDPVDLTFWREGRRATNAEVLTSIETGLPLLQRDAELDGPKGVRELARVVSEYFNTTFRKFA